MGERLAGGAVGTQTMLIHEVRVFTGMVNSAPNYDCSDIKHGWSQITMTNIMLTKNVKYWRTAKM